eukprot:CAMPEP_0170534350 /NCGR_PEP_ID=MMETSP0209-20121228/90564_1 /TAXON_ID=665100 ORGANISM="Litonotus pictus, Strain P1" /NCGR_SAMPLE_ID=MMETSP0209 /ASSEMBLY_ACC=CAM_ASM_000301 /LENGTH=273 /DNA_ID=CAMNT_0010833593 /DNA_START=284 /DNA_END=1102 /DNA_ORIENTATION=+
MKFVKTYGFDKEFSAPKIVNKNRRVSSLVSIDKREKKYAYYDNIFNDHYIEVDGNLEKYGNSSKNINSNTKSLYNQGSNYTDRVNNSKKTTSNLKKSDSLRNNVNLSKNEGSKDKFEVSKSISPTINLKVKDDYRPEPTNKGFQIHSSPPIKYISSNIPNNMNNSFKKQKKRGSIDFAYSELLDNPNKPKVNNANTNSNKGTLSISDSLTPKTFNQTQKPKESSKHTEFTFLERLQDNNIYLENKKKQQKIEWEEYSYKENTFMPKLNKNMNE